MLSKKKNKNSVITVNNSVKKINIKKNSYKIDSDINKNLFKSNDKSKNKNKLKIKDFKLKKKIRIKNSINDAFNNYNLLFRLTTRKLNKKKTKKLTRNKLSIKNSPKKQDKNLIKKSISINYKAKITNILDTYSNFLYEYKKINDSDEDNLDNSTQNDLFNNKLNEINIKINKKLFSLEKVNNWILKHYFKKLIKF